MSGRGDGWRGVAAAHLALFLLATTSCSATPGERAADKTIDPAIDGTIDAEPARRPHDPAFRRWDVVRDAVPAGDRLVAVGTGDDGLVAWTSPDGTAWSRQLVASGEAEAVALDGSGDRFVATGTGDDGSAHVWTLEGTGTWGEVLGVTAVPTGIATSPSAVVLVGESPAEDVAVRPDAWVADGRPTSWSSSPLPLAGEGSAGVVNGVVAYERSFVAVGAELRVDAHVEACVWVGSGPGSGWETARTIADPGGADLELTSVAVTGGGVAGGGTRQVDWDDPAAGGEGIVIDDLLGTPTMETFEAEPGANVSIVVGGGGTWLLVKEPVAGRGRVLVREGSGTWSEVEIDGQVTALTPWRDHALAFAVDSDGYTRTVPVN